MMRFDQNAIAFGGGMGFLIGFYFTHLEGSWTTKYNPWPWETVAGSTAVGVAAGLVISNLD